MIINVINWGFEWITSDWFIYKILNTWIKQTQKMTQEFQINWYKMKVTLPAGKTDQNNMKKSQASK